MFQKGDKVKVKDEVDEPMFGWGYPRVTHDSIGIVKSVGGGLIKINFPQHNNWNGTVDEIEHYRPNRYDTEKRKLKI